MRRKVDKQDLLLYLSTIMNSEQSEYANMRAKLGVLNRFNSGQDTMEILALIHEARKDLLETIIQHIQGLK